MAELIQELIDEGCETPFATATEILAAREELEAL